MEFFWYPVLLLVVLFHKGLELNRLKQNLNNSQDVFMSINPFRSEIPLDLVVFQYLLAVSASTKIKWNILSQHLLIQSQLWEHQNNV